MNQRPSGESGSSHDELNHIPCKPRHANGNEVSVYHMYVYNVYICIFIYHTLIDNNIIVDVYLHTKKLPVHASWLLQGRGHCRDFA